MMYMEFLSLIYIHLTIDAPVTFNIYMVLIPSALAARSSIPCLISHFKHPPRVLKQLPPQHNAVISPTQKCHCTYTCSGDSTLM